MIKETMTTEKKLAKAARVKTKLINEWGMDENFAEAVGLYMVANNNYKLSKARMPVFLAGERGAEKFRAQILNA